MKKPELLAEAEVAPDRQSLVAVLEGDDDGMFSRCVPFRSGWTLIGRLAQATSSVTLCGKLCSTLRTCPARSGVGFLAAFAARLLGPWSRCGYRSEGAEFKRQVFVAFAAAVMISGEVVVILEVEH